jgi:hypothetical protein
VSFIPASTAAKHKVHVRYVVSQLLTHTQSFPYFFFPELHVAPHTMIATRPQQQIHIQTWSTRLYISSVLPLVALTYHTHHSSSMLPQRRRVGPTAEMIKKWKEEDDRNIAAIYACFYQPPPYNHINVAMIQAAPAAAA